MRLRGKDDVDGPSSRLREGCNQKIPHQTTRCRRLPDWPLRNSGSLRVQVRRRPPAVLHPSRPRSTRCRRRDSSKTPAPRAHPGTGRSIRLRRSLTLRFVQFHQYDSWLCLFAVSRYCGACFLSCLPLLSQLVLAFVSPGLDLLGRSLLSCLVANEPREQTDGRILKEIDESKLPPENPL